MKDIFDALFMDQRDQELRSLKTVNDAMRNRAIKQQRSVNQLDKKLKSFNGDLGFTSLVLYSLLKKLIDKGVVTLEDIVTNIEVFDSLDGEQDGKLDVDVLRANLCPEVDELDVKEHEPLTIPITPKRTITIREKLERDRLANAEKFEAHKAELKRKMRQLQRNKSLTVNGSRKVGGSKNESSSIHSTRQARKNYRK